MEIQALSTTLKTIAKVVNDIRSNVTDFYTTKSLSEVSKLTTVEPLTIISKDLLTLDYIKDVNQTMLSIFAGYYLQAVSVMTTVNNVEVIKVLDSLNPNRDETGFLYQNRVSQESHCSASLENYQHELPTTSSVSLELDSEDKKTLKSMSNLSVGKMLDVNISVPSSEEKDGVAKVTIPVTVRLLASIIPNSTIAHILAFKSEDVGLVERFHSWRSGRISFIKDLIFCQDLLDEYKRAMIQDKSGTLEEIMRRVNNAKKFGALTKNPSLVSASNLFVISETVAAEVENKLGGKLSNARIRNKAFDNTYAMIIAVVDREWERVTFYTRGIDAGTDLSIKEIKNSTGGNGIDIADVMRSMQLGNSPSF